MSGIEKSREGAFTWNKNITAHHDSTVLGENITFHAINMVRVYLLKSVGLLGVLFTGCKMSYFYGM